MNLSTEKHILDCLEKVNQAMLRDNDAEKVIDNVLDTVFSIFSCDRIWLFHPCDPNAPTFRVLAEKSHPSYPGAFITGQELPVTPEAAKTIKEALASSSPVVFDPDSGKKLDDVAARFSVRSQLLMAVHPKIGTPWMFGMHQCSYVRIWDSYEQLLFKEIGNRVVEGLNNLLLMRDLKLSEEKYRRFFTSVHNGWAYHKIVVDNNNNPVDYIFLEINQAFENQTGLKSDNVIGKKVTEVLPGIEKDPADWIGRFGKTAITGESISFESYAEPIKRWYTVTASSPEPGYFITVFEDISERKLIEKEKEELLKQLKAAQKIAKLGHWELNLESNNLYWSDEIYCMFGLEPQQFKATFEAFLETVHPDDKEYVNKAYTDSVKNKTPYDIEHRIVLKNGEEKWVREICATEYNKDDKPIRSIGTVHEITDKKIASEEREKFIKELKRLKKELELRVDERTAALKRKNIALREILDQIDLEKKQITDRVKTNVENLLLPVIKKLKGTSSSLEKGYLEILEKNINELTSSFGINLADNRLNLTAKEIEICNLIKEGFTGKEIASLHNLSYKTIDSHRCNIRKKLGIRSKKVNLASYLRTLDS